eukprot:1924214-Rhodomonas_salina.2
MRPGDSNEEIASMPGAFRHTTDRHRWHGGMSFQQYSVVAIVPACNAHSSESPCAKNMTDANLLACGAQCDEGGRRGDRGGRQQRHPLPQGAARRMSGAHIA